MRYALLGLAVLFGFMGADEVLVVHERLERGLGVDWQLLYLPLMVLGAAGYAKALIVSLSVRSGRAPLVFGAACWVGAQLLERLQWGGGMQDAAEYAAAVARDEYQASVVVEEVMEMAGSLGFVLGLLAVLSAATVAARPPRGTIEWQTVTTGQPAPRADYG